MNFLTNVDINYWILVFSYVLMIALNVLIHKRWTKMGNQYLVEYRARLHAEGELKLFKSMVEKLSPELLKMHEETMVEVHVSILSRDGVGKNE